MRIEDGPNVLYFLHSPVRESWPRVVYFEPTFKSMKSFLKLYKQIFFTQSRDVMWSDSESKDICHCVAYLTC